MDRLRSSTLSPTPPGPLRSHLRKPVHVDGGALTFVFGLHGLEQVDGQSEIALNRRWRRSVIEPPDVCNLIHEHVRSAERSAISVQAGHKTYAC